MFRRMALLLLLATCAPAQEYRGTVLGRVTDSTGAVILGASVQVINADTNAVAFAATNQDGNYQVPFLLPGNYTVVVEHPGFKRVERTGVRVSVGTPVTLNFTLEVGAATESVTVSAAAPLLNTAGADIGQVVEKAYVDRITVTIRRNPMTLVHLTPGITTGGWETSYTDNSQSQIAIGGGGGKYGGVEFTIDGQPATVPSSGGVLTFVPSLDAVEEFKVHTTMFDASLGHSNGGAVSITTRGGTNDLRGAAYYHKEWPGLDANSWTNNRRGLPKPPVSRYMWGVNAAGPLFLPRLYQGKDRTFFSVSLEWDDRKQASTRRARVPTELERQGDFSQTIRRDGRGPLELYDPLTTRGTGSASTRQPFPNARIPASRIDPTGAAVMAVMPMPNLQEPTRIGLPNWSVSGYYPVLQRHFMGRLDHNFSSRNRLFARLGWLKRDQNSLDYNYTPRGWSGDNHNQRKFPSIAVDDTLIFSPSMVGSLRYGYSRRFIHTRNGDGAGLDPAELKVPQAIVSNQFNKGWPVFNPGESVMAVGGYFGDEANDLHSLIGTFTNLMGNHSLKFGADYRVVRWNQLSPGQYASGNFSFDNVFTRAVYTDARSGDYSGSGMASLLLGYPSAGGLGYNSPLSLQSHYLAGFLQEDWKVTNRLTLNFGLRYELETPYTERYNRVSSGFDYDAVLPVSVPGIPLRGAVRFAGVNGNSRRQGRVDANNFGPRFGFAFRASKDTVLRGGYGLFYGSQIYNSTFLGGVGVFNAVTPYQASIDGNATPFTTIQNPFPNGFRQPLGASAGRMAQVGDDLSFPNQNRLNPYNQQWQFSIQRELGLQTVVEAAYIGMLTLKQLESFNLNEKPDRYLALGAAESLAIPNPFRGIFPATSVLGAGATITQNRLWVAYPQFTSLRVEGLNTARAIYHGLQARVEKRLTHGLNALWNYTFSKLMEYAMGSAINPRFLRTVSDIDQSHLMKLSVVYELPARPFSGGGSTFLNQALGGWAVSAFWYVASGTPLTITHAYGRPIRIRNPAKSGPVSERLGDRKDALGNPLNPYFDVAAFQPLPNQYTISPEPPRLHELRSPGRNRVSAALFKTFRLGERLKLEARLESSDVLNTPQFDDPGTNMSNPATFGVIESATGQRRCFGALRLTF